MPPATYSRGAERVRQANELAMAGTVGGALTKEGTIEGGDYGPRTPVGSLSTESAIDTLTRNVEKLNKFSPSTNPEAPIPTAQTTTASKSTETVAKPPKAYFTNLSGQEAEYDEKQLKDPATRKFLEDGGYAMTRTEGPSMVGGEVATLDSGIDSLIEKFSNYNVDTDPTFTADKNNIIQGYAALKQEARRAGEEMGRNLRTISLRQGISRYNPEGAVRAHEAVLGRITDKLADYVSEEASAISKARAAHQAGKFSEFNNQINILDKVRTNKAATLTELNKTITEAKKKIQESVTKATRDSAIAGLVSQGITDPKDILETLNFDDAGNQVGDFSLKEIDDALKALSPDSKLEKLSGATRDFFVLKGQGLLPSSVASLPEDEQLFAYLRQQKQASTLGSGGSKITREDTSALGLPISTIGMSENDILADLQTTTPPPWFMEKLQNELKMSLPPNSEEAQGAWEEFRTDAIEKAEGSAKKETENYKKAKQYFSETYEGLTDEELDALATSVETYVNSGEYNYDSAVEQTVDDL